MAGEEKRDETDHRVVEFEERLPRVSYQVLLGPMGVIMMRGIDRNGDQNGDDVNIFGQPPSVDELIAALAEAARLKALENNQQTS